MYRRKKGFTLIELIVVICIIGVLATILVPSMIGFVRKSKRTADLNTARDIYNDAGIILAEGDEGFFSYISDGGSSTNVSVERSGESENYSLQIVGTCADGQVRGWTASGSQFEPFIDEMNKIEDSVIRLKYVNRKSNVRLTKWIIARREEDTAKIEVWAGDSSGNPIIRIWPETDDNF